jgi:DNA adenine methylase
LQTLDAPFPWFGGKRRVAAEVWRHFAGIRNYVEPFFGSGAVLLRRPFVDGIETVNDADGYVANFWRAVKHAPDAAAEWADNPVNENDLHARHAWLLQHRDMLPARLEGDPEWYDAKIAGWWCWGICCWIGTGFCSGKGPWHVVDGMLVKPLPTGRGRVRRGTGFQPVSLGMWRQEVRLGDAGVGVNRQRVHLGGAWGHGICASNADIHSQASACVLF